MTEGAAGTPRERIIAAAAGLLTEGGIDAVSTRAVAAAAGVQAPALYRLFGDKQGLLDAVAAHGFERYLETKLATPSDGDPARDLRRGWDSHVEFGLTHPAFYVLMYGTPQPGRRPAAATEAYRILLSTVERVAEAGRLRVPPETAASIVQAAGTGVTLSLIADPSGDGDPDLSAHTREIVLASITTDDQPELDASLSARALALDMTLNRQSHPLSPAEAALLKDWLRRLATG
ncbi:TetR/AcrR family transcriptional regulator [Actinosynnema sp. NPDC047251]|uniref:Transcriptional regulator, TetR family n=1 Tax=Saccharothrix espanaensis (strain ATCC 51144 / DSM 44229 / JCM 9112 / NBRC 15066 / NRRL 15764) TaxID=1179773 RepID=K0JXL7_SACES|nr:TetR/AcrR family transcriptional regulator [Saccharothrix espanaensis]CCH30067.1 Transcriptional regulator, TetR family [Saccharothrix espanaensis DSM 44229]